MKMESKLSIQMFQIFHYSRFLIQLVPMCCHPSRVQVSRFWLAAKPKSMISTLKLDLYSIKVQTNPLKWLLKKTLLLIEPLSKPKHYQCSHSEQFQVQIDHESFYSESLTNHCLDNSVIPNVLPVFFCTGQPTCELLNLAFKPIKVLFRCYHFL